MKLLQKEEHKIGEQLCQLNISKVTQTLSSLPHNPWWPCSLHSNCIHEPFCTHICEKQNKISIPMQDLMYRKKGSPWF